MRQKTTRAMSLLFFAAASVYSGRSAVADQSAGASGASGAAGPGNYFAKAPARATSSPSQGVAEPAPVVVDPDPSPVAPVDPFGQATVIDPAGGVGSVTDDDVLYDNAAGTVEIHVNEANLVEVLRMLSMQSQKNIIASKEVKGTVTANLYSVTVREALDAILAANGYAYREEGNFIYVYTAAEMQAQDEARRVRKTEVFRVYYTPVATAVNMVKPILSKDGELAYSDPPKSGLATGSTDVGGNSHATEDVMVVTDYEDRLAEVKRVLAQIDTRPQQILIEATILRATLSEDNALGVDFQILGGVDFSGLTAGGSTFGAAAGGNIINQPTAGGIVNKGFAAGGTGFSNSVPQQGGLQVGIVKNNIAVFLDALESITDTTILANPKILALNKQKGEVIVGREDGYVTSTTTETATVQTVEFLQTGTRLIFRPFIADDGFIRMEIHPEDSSGGLTGANLPFKITTEVTSNVLVRDGHTIVIGGLFREDSNSTRGQVPGLGNIPFAGALFRSQRDRTTREEIIILLTPHIIKDDATYAKMSEEELRRIDQLRVGVRRGMMGFGRERLAEGFYDAAVGELARPSPDRGKALWNLNAATNLNPKFTEAIELKRQVTQREVKAVDNSLTRDFVRRLAIADVMREAPMPPADAPPATPSVNEPPRRETSPSAMSAAATETTFVEEMLFPFELAADWMGLTSRPTHRPIAEGEGATVQVDPR